MKYMKLWFVLSVITVVCFAASPVFAGPAKVKSADGTPIVYEVSGKGEPTLVFIHCWCCDKGYWSEQVPVFAKKYRVVALDLAGHGDSGLERKEWTVQAYGQDVAAVVKDLGLGKVILVGHSMGGPVALEAARLLPGQVISVIGVDTLGNIEEKFPEEQKKSFLAMMKQDFPNTTRSFLGAMMFTEKTDPVLKEKIIADMSCAPAEVGIASMESMWNLDLPALVKASAVPVLCINSDKFPMDIEAGKRHAVSYDIKVIKGYGHFLHMEDPTTFNRVLQETIDELVKK